MKEPNSDCLQPGGALLQSWQGQNTLVAAEGRRRLWGATDTALGHVSLDPKDNLKVAQATSWSNMVSPKQAKNLLAFLFLVARPRPLVASLLLVAMPLCS